jgi:heptosyltransferase-2
LPPLTNKHSTPPRILVRGANWLGDAVMTTPALLRLREAFPGSEIALLTHTKLAKLWLGHPAIDQVIEFAAGESVFAAGRKLRARNFDLALILPNSPRSALEAWRAGIPRRVGLARPWRNWFLTQAIPPRAGQVEMRKRSANEIRQLLADERKPQPPALPAAAHHIHHYLHLVAALGGNPAPIAPMIVVSSEELAGIRQRINATDQPVVGLNPGAEYGPAKRWPIERFIAAAAEIQNRTACLILLLGGQGDVEITRQIAAALPGNSVNLAGVTNLRELCAALKACRVVITNDTGPMHLAAAVGAPVVAIFGSTSPELTAPGLPGDPRHCLLTASVPCSPCFLRECPVDFRCMKEIAIEHAVAAVKAILNKSNDCHWR